MIAQIAVEAAIFAIDKPYSYLVPSSMEVRPGSRVIVPFGRGNRPTEGIVLALQEEAGKGLKSVERLLDEEPALDEELLHLAAFVRDRYFCTFYDAVHAVLPAGLWYEVRDTFTLTAEADLSRITRQKTAAGILSFLKELGGAGDYPTLRKAFADEDALKAGLRYLLNKKMIASDAEFLRRAGDKTERIASLTVSAEETMAFAETKRKSAPSQYAALSLLCQVGQAAVKELCYFSGATSAAFRRLEELGYVTLSQRTAFRCREIQPAKLSGPLVLNESQEQARASLSAQMQEPAPGVSLLYGVTGSGKTSVYIKLIEETLEKGKSAILLVPEIGLTPQLLSLMAAHFGSQVGVLHSSLSTGERYDQWKRIRAGEARVVIGTRSAVFAPCKKLGLIILDEEQEHTYKSENTPRYHAREVAIWRGARNHALVLLGSATPSVETMYRARSGQYGCCTLDSRFNGGDLPQAELVDMKQELREGSDGSISKSLRDAILENIQKKEQTVLFLNRRGTSQMVLCVDCGQVPDCPRCAMPLAFHGDNRRLMCHYCGFSQPMPRQCPQCGGHLKQVGTGTQRVEQELREHFPEAEIARMDGDTVSATNPHEKILGDFQKNNTPILLGTQMVAKGLNLPNVTLVGVLDGDLSLYSSNFRAAETTFSMVTQVVGRAGRGDKPGRALIQTMSPEHPVLTLAARQDYGAFYELELNVRRTLGLPPFRDILTLTFSGPEDGAAFRMAWDFGEKLRAGLQNSVYGQEAWELLGPAPAPVPKINYNYRYCLTLRCKITKALRLLVAHLLRELPRDGSARRVRAYADVNGYE